MNSIKCKSCGLKNFPTDVECRRCGGSFAKRQAKSGARSPRRFSVWSFVMIAAVAGTAYYFYTGVQAGVEQVDAKEAKRVASQPTDRSTGLSRSASDKQRSGHFGDAVRESQSIKSHTNRTQETEKATQQISNTR